MRELLFLSFPVSSFNLSTAVVSVITSLALAFCLQTVLYLDAEHVPLRRELHLDSSEMPSGKRE